MTEHYAQVRNGTRRELVLDQYNSRSTYNKFKVKCAFFSKLGFVVLL